MSEEANVKVKWLTTELIPVSKIDMNELQARQDKINAGLEAFAEQIRGVGQIQSIVVYRKGDRFELLVGQRRFFAFQKEPSPILLLCHGGSAGLRGFITPSPGGVRSLMVLSITPGPCCKFLKKFKSTSGPGLTVLS